MGDEIRNTEAVNALVGDEEEYSYSGYSEGTTVVSGGRGAYFSGDEEEYSYSGYSEDRERYAGEHAMADAVRSGDFIIEEFSPQTNARAVEKIAHLKEDTILYLLSAVYIIVGALCVSITSHMTFALPYIVGAMMAVVGVVRFVFAIKSREYVHTESNKTASSLILMALSVLILLDSAWASVFIPTVWGILGLFEGAHAFNHAFSRIARGMRSAYYIVKGIAELVFAFLLLYDPLHHIDLHLIIFGVQLIFRGVTAIPALKKRLSKR